MGTQTPKQFLCIRGMPILVRTLSVFLECLPQSPLVLVLPREQKDTWQQLASAHFEADQLGRIHLCEGGTSRTASVNAGLQRLQGLVAEAHRCLVAIHDGVRPLVTPQMIRQSFEVAASEGAAVCTVPLKASIRKRTAGGKTQAVKRDDFLEVQTPQTFRLSAILQAYQQRAQEHFTDDASLFEAAGGEIAVCEGSYENIKITTPEDLAIAAIILEKRMHDSAARLPQPKMVIIDVDGTLTDGGMYVSSSGEQIRKFHTRDTLALHRLVSRYHLPFGLVSAGTHAALLEVLSRQLGISHVYAGTLPKVTIIQQWLDELNLGWQQIAYLGDDLNDLPVFSRVGCAACPADAATQVRQAARVVLSRKGGAGCIREFLEEVLGYDLLRT